ncbi:MAG: IMP dehydrogenase, partial [Helicobacter sp.]|nr:IMP dehydrogenase [Helicobacter sp.]
MKLQTRALTFEDVLLVPQYSDVLPSEVLLTSKLSRSIPLNAPILSAAMDTVTEYRMAIAVARQGGIGIIHKNMSTELQCEQVVKVKKSESGIIIDPVHIEAHNSLAEAKAIMDNYKISGVPVVDNDKTLIGILTNRDIRFESDFSKNVGSVMTSKNLVTSEVGTSLDAARDIMHAHRIEKLPLVDSSGKLKGLITIKDIQKKRDYPHANKDSFGRLRVGAAIGVRQFERASMLVESGVDVLVLDSAHGHS